MEDSQNTQPTSTSESCDPTSVKRQLDFSDSAIPSLKTLSLKKKGWYWGFYQPKPNSPDMRSCKLCLTIQDDNPTHAVIHHVARLEAKDCSNPIVSSLVARLKLSSEAVTNAPKPAANDSAGT